MIELSSGHVFAENSVKSISPISPADLDPDTDMPWDHFAVIGVGFKVNLYSDDLWEGVGKANKAERARFKALHQEAIQKLLKD